ncbi:1,2-oxophytodienoate reductase [Streptomonospora alba]|uniref:1,2-oxophytodienoate reductase n=1 Tax=Streptomonospora alba TaxID=183763 RepID=A0A0C2FBU7_9ACTN|nr:alkene reductase [Streptomonospora alba]KIH96594.1 1,2-oxophytodienoate reductase [Streptomonospora alba]
MRAAFTPTRVGRHRLENRIVMSPMTRSRAFGPELAPTDMMATYYAQRAGAGLIITEGTQPSAVGQGYPNTPGLHTGAQITGWRTVTDAVHAEGGTIYAQLMHTGRIGHPANYRTAHHPVGPSPVKAEGRIFTEEGLQDFVVPRELGAQEIGRTIRDFADAARNAVEAGFDGVEIHGANGYLIHQFLSTNANRRTDDWGASAPNRARFALEVVAAVAEAIGGDRTAIRISPANPFNDIEEEDFEETYSHLVEELNGIGPAYLHVLESRAPEFSRELRRAWNGAMILNPATPGARTAPEHLALVDEGVTDLVSFGQYFISNPDLPERLATGAELAEPDMSKAYGGDERGYTDYPTLAVGAVRT